MPGPPEPETRLWLRQNHSEGCATLTLNESYVKKLFQIDFSRLSPLQTLLHWCYRNVEGT